MNVDQHTKWLDLDYKPKLPKDKSRGIGIVGAGGIIEAAHLPAYEMAGFHVVGIYDLEQDKAQKLADRFGIKHVFQSLEHMLEHPDIDIVDVAVPAKNQLQVVKQVVASKKHILCQKPLKKTVNPRIVYRIIC